VGGFGREVESDAARQQRHDQLVLPHAVRRRVGRAARGAASSSSPGGRGGARPARPRLERIRGGRAGGALWSGHRHRSALHPLHVGHEREAQGRRARQRLAHTVGLHRSMRNVCGARAGDVHWAAPTSAGSSGTATSSMHRSSWAAPTVLSQGKPVGTRRRRVLARDDDLAKPARLRRSRTAT
jgi:hypothetical protein